MKLDAFTIFLILLGLLVVISIFMNWNPFSKKESFVNFQNNEEPGTLTYIPQYTSDPTKKVFSLYDNLYFNQTNGDLIEVFAPACSSNCDTTGKNITDISILPRDGRELISVPTVLDSRGDVKPYSTSESRDNELLELYNHFVYTTSCVNTNIYQVFYISWFDETFIHILDMSASTVNGKIIKTIHIKANRLLNTQSTFPISLLSNYSSEESTMAISNNSNNLTTNTDVKYFKGKVSYYELGIDDDNNSISYDNTNGNIIIKSNTTISSVYNRNGFTVGIQDVKNADENMAWQSMPNTHTFIINDISGVSIIVSSHDDNTIISLLTTSTNKYKLLNVYRFNKSGYVYDITSDEVNNPTSMPTPKPTFSPASTTVPNLGDTNNVSNLNNADDKSNVCGDDLSCKWYWYFNTIAQTNKDGSKYLSDDYFLKTEAVPPVCPECPQCNKNGPCTNCGGNGGCGATTSTESPSKLPNGAIKDSSGNVYVPYKGKDGSTRYKSLTAVDKDGEFVTTADPNTLGGSLAVTSLGLGQVGTAGLNTVGDVANNALNTTGNIVGGTVGTAADLLKSTGSGAVGLVKDTGSGAVGFLKDIGSGIVSLGGETGVRQQGQQGQQGVTVSNNVGGYTSGGYGQLGAVSDKNFGSVPGQTTVDNYSYFGALQSKGDNYMPVTADFSSFRK